MGTLLVETNFEGANLTGCQVYGISAWNVNLTGTQQSDLVITQRDEPVITVDNLEVAQFIFLLLHNEKIRHVIDTITSKAVLILGRFTPERKAVLDAIREALRQRNYLVWSKYANVLCSGWLQTSLRQVQPTRPAIAVNVKQKLKQPIGDRFRIRPIS